jgi:hypothetical protein
MTTGLSVKSAPPRLIESFQVSGRLQRPDGITVAGRTLGELLISVDETDVARQVLVASDAAAAKLGWTDMVQEINEMLGSLPSESEGT